MPTVVEIPADLLAAIDTTFQLGRRHIFSPQAYTAHVRVSGPTDERWVAQMTLPQKDREALDRLMTTFDLGDGAAGYYSAFDIAHTFPRGTATGLVYDGDGAKFSDGATFSDGSEFASGITQSTLGAAALKGAEYVTITGLLASQTVGFAVGDHFAIAQGSENYGFLHHVVANAATDSNGDATVRIRPRLRQAVGAGQVVHFLRPRGVFRLSDEAAVSVSRGGGGLGQARLSLIEIPEALTCAL